MAKNDGKNRLGTGLSQLLGGQKKHLYDNQNPAFMHNSMVIRAVKTVPVETIEPNPSNPRKNFSESSIDELAQSIKEKNIIQPVLVRFVGRREDGIRFQIIAGERRWRASKKIGLKQIPVIEINIDEAESKELALIENMQRANLNPVEEANGYKDLMRNQNMDINKMIRILGKSRSHILNTIRLLALPEDVQNMLIDGSISSGHARALINREDAVKLAKIIVEKKLSVRQVEEITQQKPKKETEDKSHVKIKQQKTQKQLFEVSEVEKQITKTLGIKTKIAFTKKKDSGKIILYYKNEQQFKLLQGILTAKDS